MTNHLYDTWQRQLEDWKINQVYGPEVLFEKLYLPVFEEKAFANAIHLFIEQHESVRTSFEFHNGLLYQKINQPENFVWYLGSEKLNEINEYNFIKHEEKLMADLSKPPLLKIFVSKNEENGAWIYFLIHHIISDDWSMNVLIDEVQTAYLTYLEKAQCTLSCLPCQLKDYSLIANDKHFALKDKATAYWTKKLEMALLNRLQKRLITRLKLKGSNKLSGNFNNDIIKALDENGSARTVSYSLAASTRTYLIALAKQNNVSIPNIILTILIILMYNQFNLDDILISSLVNDRFHKGSRRLIANLTAGVFLRSKIQPGDIVSKLISSVYRESLQSFRYMIFDYAPYDTLPLRSASLLHFNYIEHSTTPFNNQTAVEDRSTDRSFYPLSLKIIDSEKSSNLIFVYNHNFYYGSEISELFNKFEKIASRMYYAPQSSIELLISNKVI